jgi:hypothetical protein
MAKYNINFFQYLEANKRNILATPLNLGGIAGSGGGLGAPPGGFTGYLPQSRVTYDTTEAAYLGFAESGAVDASGVVVSASLVDNLAHIRYRLNTLESGAIEIYDDDVLVASGIAVLDFKGDFLETSYVAPNEVEITVSGKKTFTDLDDTPGNYTGQGNKFVSVKGDVTGLEFITISGAADNFKAKVSANDTTEDFLENKIVAGSGIQVTTLNDGSDEDVEISVGSHTHVEADTLDLSHDADLIKGVTVSALAPSTDDILSYDGTNWKPVPAGSGNTGVIGFGYSATLSGGLSLPVRMHAPWAGTISNVTATVSTAPTVSAVIIDINKNGTTIFTTQGNRPTIAAGTQDDLSSTPDVTTVAQNDVFTCDIDQVGVSPGAGLVVQVRVDL